MTFVGVARRSFPLWFGAIWLVCGAPFLVIGLYTAVEAFREDQRFRRDAEVGEGMVLAKRIARNGDSRTYRVEYRFRAPDGTVLKRETSVSPEFWDRLVEREPVRVRFLPDRPERQRLEDEGPDWTGSLIFSGLGLVFAPLGGWVFFRGLREIRR
ncbi:MAG TPA: DUF3592 domain-containing protein [Candidatus Binatia bacterium]|nr:DUF3592 domain-containing protein [Candidatus Binatia bacterium]